MPPTLPVDPAAVVLAGVACLFGRLPPLPLAFFVAPYPPSPLPRRGRGRPRLFHARGFAPCIPSIKPFAAQAEPEKQAPGGGLPPALPADPAAVMLAWAACLFGRLPALPLVFDSAPYPPSPLPRRGRGETLRLFCRGLPPPAPRALNRLRHLQTLPCRYPGTESLAAQAEPEKQAPGWGLPPALPVDPAMQVPGG